MAARKTPSKGAKPDKIMRDALIVALHREAADSDGKMAKRLNLVADALVEKAQGGDVAAIREIFDRIEGKAKQPLEHTGEGGGPVLVVTGVPRDDGFLNSGSDDMGSSPPDLDPWSI